MTRYNKVLVCYETNDIINYLFICLHTNTIEELKNKVNKIMENMNINSYEIKSITGTSEEDITHIRNWCKVYKVGE